MKSFVRITAGTAAAIFGAACADLGTSTIGDVGAVAAFESVPAGFSSTSSSFDAAGELPDAFLPRRGDGSFDDDGRSGRVDDRGRGRGRGGRGDRGPGFGFLMGGGIGRDFLGEIGFGRGKGRGPFRIDDVGTSCVFASSTGVVTCGPITRAGLTITATAAISTVDGTPQSKVDGSTNTIVLHSEVNGTKTRGESATSVIAHRSDRRITGLADGSAQRTVDGTAVGTETTTGTTDAGTFESIRTVNDTTTGVIVPLEDGRPTYPTAGRVSRNMSVSITVDGATTTHKRSEVVSYDGSATATVVITQDGTTKNCTLPLPRGRVVCQ